MMLRRYLLILAGLLSSPFDIALASSDASFACSGAKLPIEKTIRASPELAQLDRALSQAFKSAVAGPAKSEILASQRRWLSERARKCHADGPLAVDCLIAAYKDRVAVLQASHTDASMAATCEAVANSVRQGQPFSEEARAGDTDEAGRPFVGGTTTPVPKDLKTKLYRYFDEEQHTVHALEQGEYIDIEVPNNLIAIKSNDLGTLQCDALDLFLRLPDHTLKAANTPTDDHPAANFGCASLDLGHDRAKRPIALSVTGNAAELIWQFTPWLGSAWGGNCRVRASYKVELRPNGASCRAGVDCGALARDALGWAKAWEALGFQHDEPRPFGGLRKAAGQGGAAEAREVPDFSKNGTDAFDQFEVGAPVYTGQSAIGAVDFKISYPHFGDRAQDAIIVGIFRKDGDALAGFKFDRVSSAKPTNVTVEQR